jgi:hypothetical protein
MTQTTTATGESVTDGLIVRGRPPFAMTPTSLLRNPALSSHAVRLWSVLASYTYGDRATDRPSRAQLAADVGWKSPRSVDGYLAELQDAGYLTVQRRRRPDGGKARNLYILEWEPQDRSTSDGTGGPHPVDNSVSTAHPHAQNPAHGGAPDAGGSVDKSVGAGQDHAQDSAHGVTTPGTHGQDSAHAHGQDSAHLGKESTTKKEEPPADLPPSPVRFHVPPAIGTTARATDLAAESDALVRVIRDRLPDRLRAQLSTATLRTRAQALAGAGWTAQPLAVAVADRVWNGAHGGAVITWLTELANVGPPRAAPNNDSRTTTLRLRAEAARAKSAAAGADSPARAAARQLAAQLGRRRSS